MSESRGPVRHGSRARRPIRTSSVQHGLEVEQPQSEDLQAVFTALARRAKLPTGPDARPTEVLRTAGIPLLLAAIVASTHAAPGADSVGDAAPAPGALQPGVGGGWTVTSLQPQNPGQSAAPANSSGSSGSSGSSAPAPPARKHASHHAPPRTASKPKPSTPSTPQVTYTVRPGDTLAGLARHSGRSVEAIAALNHLTAGQTLVPGQVLRLPEPSGSDRAAKTTSPGPARTAKPKARAQPIEPHQPKVTATAPQATAPKATAPKTTQPRAAASPKAAQPKTAQPGPRRPGPAASAGSTYVVRQDDSLIGISQQHHVKLHDLLELNHLHLESVIHPGDHLVLPAPPKPDSATTAAGRTYPAAVVAAANANRKALANARVPSRDQVQAMVVSTARSMGVDPALALGIAYLESGFQQRIVSPANAVGVMQVIPSTGRWASKMVGRTLDVMDAKDNVTAGVALLRALLRTADTEAQAVAGYYQGLASVQRSGMFDDTRRYVANVLTLRTRFAAGA